VTPAVDVRDAFCILRTRAGEAAALRGLTLAVASGQVVGVLGPSGSGKTTLLRLLAGLERPAAGSARVLGVEPSRLRRGRLAAFRARRLGLVDQHYDRALPPDLPCAEIVALQPALLGVPARERRARAHALLERVGLADAAARLPRELSGGEQQRVAVCAALAHRPGLVLADEPAGELDAANVEAVYRLIRELARAEGASVVLVSHDPSVAAVCDRTVRIRDGRVAGEIVDPGTRREAIVVDRDGWLRLPDGAGARDGLADAIPRDGGVLVVPRSAATPAARRPGPADVPPPAPPPSGPPAAEVRAVEKAWGTGARRRVVFTALDAIFPAGAVTAVTGRSGSGKSTLLRLLAGLELPIRGDVLVGGEPLAGKTRAALARLRRERVGLVGQDAGLVPYLSALENVALGLALRGRADEDAARAWLGRLGLGERLAQPVARLSAGERQRVALALAVAPAQALLLLDEPTARLDESASALVAGLLVTVARASGAAVVCASHDAAVVDVCDRELRLGPSAPAPAQSAAAAPRRLR
jgi:ABC-type lipoprotein export system ATPase subunit